MSTKAELACVYASLILVDDDVAVTVSTNTGVSVYEMFCIKIYLHLKDLIIFYDWKHSNCVVYIAMMKRLLIVFFISDRVKKSQPF